MTPQPRRGIALACLVAAVAVAAVWLRIERLGTWSLAADEYYTLVEAEMQCVPAAERTDEQARLLRWPWLTVPIWHALATGSVSVFGSSELAIRLPACVAGLTALAVLAWLAGCLLGRRVGWILFALIGLSPYHVELCRYARYPSFLFLFGGVTLLAAIRWEQSGRRRWFGLTALAATALATSHFTGLVVVGAIGLWWLFVAEPRRRSRWIAAAVLGLGAAPWMITVLAEFLSEFPPPAAPTWQRTVLHVGYNVGPLPLLAMFAARSERRGVIRATLWLIGVSSVLLFVFGMWVDTGPRYFASLVPGLYMLAALGLARIRRGFLVAAIVVGSQVPLLLWNRVDAQRYDFPAAAAQLESWSNEGDVVFADNHAMLARYVDRSMRELPKTFDRFVSEVERTASSRRLFVVVLRQRGRVAGFRGSDLLDSCFAVFCHAIQLHRRTA